MALVLIATDDYALYSIIAAECAGEGHDSAWAVTGQEAMEIVLAQGPDLVLADVKLAIFNGYELCEILHADPEVPTLLPVFLMSDDEINPRVLQRVQAKGVFPKTHSTGELRELLAEQLRDGERLAREREGLRMKRAG